MDTDIIYPIIRRNNRNWLIFLLIAFGLICLTIYMSLNSFDNALHGPYEVTQEDIINIQNLNDVKNYYVTITGDRVTDSGFQYVTDSNKVEKSYMLLQLNKKLLLVELMGDESRDIEYTGTLVPFGSEIQREVVDKLNDYPAYKKALLPFMLKTYDFVVPTYLSMVILVLLAVVCLWRIIVVLLRISDNSRHSIIRNLKRFGEPNTLIPQIERELAATDHIQVGKTIHLTMHWLIQSTNSSFKATPLSDLMWIYKQVIQHRTYGIPVRKTYAALIYDRYGKTINVRGKEDLITKILANVAAHAPWAKIGYSKEIQSSWKKDRAGFIATVDQRKQHSNQ